MEYDYSELTGRIVTKCSTRSKFAEKMGLSERALSLKLNNKLSWKQNEMEKASEVLDFSKSDIQTYFFTLKVQ